MKNFYNGWYLKKKNKEQNLVLLMDGKNYGKIKYMAKCYRWCLFIFSTKKSKYHALNKFLNKALSAPQKTWVGTITTGFHRKFLQKYINSACSSNLRRNSIRSAKIKEIGLATPQKPTKNSPDFQIVQKTTRVVC